MLSDQALESAFERQGKGTVDSWMRPLQDQDSSSFSVQENEVNTNLIAITGDRLWWQEQVLWEKEMMYKIAVKLRLNVQRQTSWDCWFPHDTDYCTTTSSSFLRHSAWCSTPLMNSTNNELKDKGERFPAPALMIQRRRFVSQMRVVLLSWWLSGAEVEWSRRQQERRQPFLADKLR
jgi:hypothetical protein